MSAPSDEDDRTAVHEYPPGYRPDAAPFGGAEGGAGSRPPGGAAPGASDPADDAPHDAADLGDDRADAVDPDEDPRLDGAGLSPQRLLGVLESLLFVSDRPLTLERLRELLPGLPPLALRTALELLAGRHRGGPNGLRLHQVAGGYQLRTAPANAPYVQKLLQAKPVRLSRAQLETLAIIAYRQPITRPEIDDIRGVDSGGTLKMLLERGLVRILGKKEEPGRPMLYGTTREFLEFFNLRDLRDLPTLREFYELSEEHQGLVGGGKADQGLVDLEPEPGSPEPAPPPPLTRVELKDLDLGDDEAQLREIDTMIETVRMDFKLDEVLGVAQGGGAAPAAGGASADEGGATAPDDEREPEEL